MGKDGFGFTSTSNLKRTQRVKFDMLPGPNDATELQACVWECTGCMSRKWVTYDKDNPPKEMESVTKCEDCQQ